MLPVGHTEFIETIEFSPDSKYVLTTSVIDNMFKVWEANTGKLVLASGSVEQNITGTKFSADGNYLFVIYKDGWLAVWKMEEGREEIKLKNVPAYSMGKDTIRDDIELIGVSPGSKYFIIATEHSVYSYWGKGKTEEGVLKQLHHYNKKRDDLSRVIGINFTEEGSNAEINYAGGDRLKWRLADGQLIDSFKANSPAMTIGITPPIIKVEGSKIIITYPQRNNQTIALAGHSKNINQHKISPSGKYLVTNADDSTIKVWEVADGKSVATFDMNDPEERNFVFNAGETRLMINESGLIKVFDIVNSKQLPDLLKERIPNGPEIIGVSPDGKYLAWGKDLLVKIWDLRSGELVTLLHGHSDKLNTVAYDHTNNLLLSASWDKYPRVWDYKTGKVLQHFTLGGSKTSIGEATVAAFDKTAQHIISYNLYGGPDAKLWNLGDSSRPGNRNFNIKEYEAACFSNNGKNILAWKDNDIFILNVENAKVVARFGGNRASVNVALFSPDDRYVASSFSDSSVKIWSVKERKLIAVVAANTSWPDCLRFNCTSRPDYLRFNSDGKLLMVAQNNGIVKIWETATGRLVNEIKTDHKGIIFYAIFSPDGMNVVTASHDETFKVWQVSNKKLLTTITAHKGFFKFSSDFDVVRVLYSGEGKYFFTSSGAGLTKKWDAKTFQELGSIEDGGFVQDITSDSKRLVTIDNAIIRFFNTSTMELELSYLPVDSTDYLVVDKYYRYDGTEAARKLLYFTCGTEIIELDQVKDQLWVPNLAERINNGETINAKTLDELNICGLTPLVEEVAGNPDEYYFTIKPRRGGLGDINLSINGVIADTRKPEQLTKNGDVYEFRIIKNEFISYLPDGQMNTITLKAYTADNTISSRVASISIDKTQKPAPPPNLYAVMVGVSDYKGDKMDLDFAAIDATDVSSALKDAAGKLLGKEHVFMYNLTTAKEHYMFPEKNSIKKVFEEIGKMATANDILFIFFSGHGVMEGEGKKQFYYLTADAADFDAYVVAGISTTELTEWIKPQNIKAQKRILILDACHSGQAINDFVKLGDENQGLAAAKGDDKAQQVKAIDKLNEKSGLFILSASAGDKLAFESQRHSHGYLTYSLLTTIKEQPDILEDGKFLNISRWFNAAGKTVDEVAKEEGFTQETQIVTTTDFNIGLVDDEVTGKIKLSEGKQLFSASNFQNSSEAISDDDLDLGKLINAELGTLSLKGAESKIMFIPSANSPEAFRLSGRYLVKGNSVTVTVNIRQNKVFKSKFVLSGTKDKLEELAVNIVNKAAVWVEANKKP